MPVQDNTNNTFFNTDQYLFKTSQTPSSDVLAFVINQIYSDSLFQIDFNDMINYFGIPRINWATIDIKSETNYVISIPMIKDEEITSFIFYTAFYDYYQITFQSLEEVFYSLNNHSTPYEFTNLESLALIKYSNLLFLTEGKYSQEILDWIEINTSEINQGQSSERMEIVMPVMVIIRKIYSNYTEDIITADMDIIIECEGITWVYEDPPGGGGGGSGSGGGGGGGGGSSNPPKIDIPDFESLYPNHIVKDCYHFSFTPEAIEELLSILNGVSLNCHSDLSPGEVVNSILEKLCEINGGIDGHVLDLGSINLAGDIVLDNLITRDMVFDEFAGEDDYVIYNHLKTSCPKLHCIVDHLMSSDPGEALCPDFIMDILSPFIDDGKLHLHINSAEFIGDKEGANGFTTLNFGEGDNPMANVYITMEEAHCTNSNSINLYETFLHELIHADIKRRLIVDFGLTNVDDIDDLFQELLEEMGYDGNNWDNEHQLMLEHYLSGMVEALYLANGGIGDKDAYYGFILNGFGSTPDYLYDWAKNWRPNDFESDQDVTNFINSQMSFFDDQNNIHSNFDLCDD